MVAVIIKWMVLLLAVFKFGSAEYDLRAKLNETRRKHGNVQGPMLQ
jgi:hypothetical protein